MYKVEVPWDLLDALQTSATAGITEHDTHLEAFFEEYAEAARFGRPEPVAEIDWVKHTEEAWPPILVGKRFFLVAPWRTEPTPESRLRLVINPGMSCGTGRHPCTQLCLEAMERIVRPGDRVLDVGAGSGILSEAARLLGASLVVACDIDPDLSPAAENYFVGSADAVRAGAFDVAVANISYEAVEELRPDLDRVARRLILSGFTDHKGQWTCIVV